MSQILLIRHGESTANLLNVVDGGDGMNAPLTSDGRAQARKAGAYIRVQYPDAVALYSSPLLRANETAKEIGAIAGLDVVVDSGLAEGNIGAWNGRPIDHPDWQLLHDDPDYREHGGESPRQLAIRSSQTLVKIAETHLTQRVLVVTHGATIRAALAQLLCSTPLTGKQYQITNTGITTLDFHQLPRVLREDDTTHLKS